jgi:hypothetical protein
MKSRFRLKVAMPVLSELEIKGVGKTLPKLNLRTKSWIKSSTKRLGMLASTLALPIKSTDMTCVFGSRLIENNWRSYDPNVCENGSSLPNSLLSTVHLNFVLEKLRFLPASSFGILV